MTKNYDINNLYHHIYIYIYIVIIKLYSKTRGAKKECISITTEVYVLKVAKIIVVFHLKQPKSHQLNVKNHKQKHLMDLPEF